MSKKYNLITPNEKKNVIILLSDLNNQMHIGWDIEIKENWSDAKSIDYINNCIYQSDLLKYVIKYRILTMEIIEKFKSNFKIIELISEQELPYEFLLDELHEFNLYEAELKCDINNKNHIAKLIENNNDKYEIDKLSYEMNNQ